MCGCRAHHVRDALCTCICSEHEGWHKSTSDTTIAVDFSVLEEASGLIYGDRKEQYGNARKNFEDIGILWGVVLNRSPIQAEEVALCLLQLKVARAINDTRNSRDIKRDTIVDLAGYAGCIEKIQKGL